jgi:hypothetical protein
MIALHKIKYNGYSSIDFDVLCDCAFDSESGEVSSFLNREAVASESYRGDFRRIHNFRYNEFFTPKFTFVKRDFSDFTADEYRRLVSWLTSKSTTSVLTAYRDDSNVEFEAIGGWGDIQPYKIANHRTIGVTAVFESVSPYALSPIQKRTVVVKHPADLFISCNTDDWESPVYPRITIQQTNDIIVNLTSEMASTLFEHDNYIDGTVYHCNGVYYWKAMDENGQMTYYKDATNTSGFDTTSVMLHNETANVKTYIKGNTANETIIIDGANKLMFTEKDGRKVLGNDFAWKWLPLVRGYNIVHIVGNCTVTFEWREPIKLGEF